MTDNANSAANHVHPPAPSAAAASIGDEVNGGSSGGARGYPTGTTAAASAAAAGSTTITITNATPQQQQLQPEVLRLTLRPRPNVTWCVSKRKFRLATRHDYWKTIFCVRGVEAAFLRFVLFAHD